MLCGLVQDLLPLETARSGYDSYKLCITLATQWLVLSCTASAKFTRANGSSAWPDSTKMLRRPAATTQPGAYLQVCFRRLGFRVSFVECRLGLISHDSDSISRAVKRPTEAS